MWRMEFFSDRFAPYLPEEAQQNPGAYGFELAHWLSIEETIAIGLRYKKRDQALSEDIFEIKKNDPDVVTPYYKGRYQAERAEYQGTHKLEDVGNDSFTSVNTCCLYLGGQNGS